MRGFCRMVQHQVLSAIWRILFGDSSSRRIPEFALSLFLEYRAPKVLQVKEAPKNGISAITRQCQ